MKIKVFCLFLVAALAGLVAGCVETADGRSQAGVPFVKDSFEDRYERPQAEVFDAAKKVLIFNGAISAENLTNHSLEAKVNQSTVWVRVDEVDPAKPVTRVVVQARAKGGAPDLDLAHEMSKQIALQLVAH